jgi:two-component system response regulator EvgA
MQMAGRLIIADDHWVVRHALRSLLASRLDLEIVGEASDGSQVMELAETLNPDLIILDISLPVMSGMQVLAAFKSMPRSPAVLVFTMHPADQYLKHVVTLGARGFMSKDSDASKIISGIDAILSGRTAFPIEPGGCFNRRRKSQDRIVGPLSKREDEVLRALVHGERNGDIALRLKISAKTVSTYRTRIFEKLNVENNAELVALAIQTGLVVARQQSVL